MPVKLDEYGIPVKSAPPQANVDEYGIEIKKKSGGNVNGSTSTTLLTGGSQNNHSAQWNNEQMAMRKKAKDAAEPK